MTQKIYLKPPQTNLVSNSRLKVKIIKKKSCLMIMTILSRHIVNLKKIRSVAPSSTQYLSYTDKSPHQTQRIAQTLIDTDC